MPPATTSQVNTAPDDSHTLRLARFVCDTRWEELPDAVRHEAKRSLLNYLAVCLGGCNDPTINAAVRTFLPFRAGNGASLVGRPERFDMLNASALNAMAANVYDFDDTHIPTIVHPTAPVAPALAALAQSRPVHGRDFLLAFSIGVEVECRIASAISPSHYSRGWHITSTCGVFGSAAGAAHILGLDAQTLVSAWGSAAAQSAGLVETLGTSAKSISVGNAARNGLLSALLAAQGFEGPAAPLTGTRGFLRVVADQPNLQALEANPSWGWELMRNTYKPYPCGIVLHPVIDACLNLAGKVSGTGCTLDDVKRIVIAGHPLLKQRTDRPQVANGRLSQVSAQHAVGVVLQRRRAGLDEFSDKAVSDQAVRALGATVQFADDADMPVDAARVTIEFADGSMLTEEVKAPHGSLARPMSDSDIELKLKDLCRYGKSGIDASPLIDALWSLDECDDVSTMLALASPVAR